MESKLLCHQYSLSWQFCRELGMRTAVFRVHLQERMAGNFTPLPFCHHLSYLLISFLNVSSFSEENVNFNILTRDSVLGQVS
jgi:hypothetical protein